MKYFALFAGFMLSAACKSSYGFQTESAVSEVSLFKPQETQLTIVQDSARYIIRKSGINQVTVNVSISEKPNENFETFSRDCFIEHQNPETSLKYPETLSKYKDSVKYAPALFFPNKTHRCYQTFEVLKFQHSYLNWDGDSVKDKGRITHTASHFKCIGFSLDKSKYMCEVLPTDPANKKTAKMLMVSGTHGVLLVALFCA